MLHTRISFSDRIFSSGIKKENRGNKWKEDQKDMRSMMKIDVWHVELVKKSAQEVQLRYGKAVMQRLTVNCVLDVGNVKRYVLQGV